MKLKDTITPQQTVDLFNGEVVGFFPYLVLSSDSFYKHLYELCLNYYTSRSAEKTISPVFDRIINLHKEGNLSKSVEQIIGEMIRGKFIEKWERVYSVLVTEQYDALHNKDYTDTKEANNRDVDTYNSNKNRNGTNTDTVTFDTTVVDDGKVGTKETTTRTSSDTNSIYGFNSIEPVGDSNSSEDITETVVGDANDNTTHNSRTRTGTETKDYTLGESEAHTGTDTKDITIDETVKKVGRDVSAAELIEAELNLRNSTIFFDVVYKDIDSILTLKIYV